jgi:hemoglobin
MIAKPILALVVTLAATPALAQTAPDPAHMPGEDAVDPYVVSDANAGAAPFSGTEMFEAFHGQAGIDRIVDGMVERNVSDPRIADIFARTDLVRLRRTLKEQFCYILGGPCHYTGRDMVLTHAQVGLQSADMAPLVENLQAAMTTEGVPIRVQNRFLARIAPMKRDMITR